MAVPLMAAAVFGLAAFALLVAFAFIVFALKQGQDPGD